MHAAPQALRLVTPPPEMATGESSFLIARVGNFERPADVASARNARVERALDETVGRPQIVTYNLALGQTVMIVANPLPRLAQLKRALNGMSDVLIGHGTYVS